ncbi:MAG: carboxylating nicotinate-nucleotide diphosphorylase [Bacteroidota bacterium]
MNLQEIIKAALIEDIGSGDHTSLATIPIGAMGKARLLVKQKGILAGVDVAAEVFNIMDSTIIMHRLLQDGTPVNPGDIAFTVDGPSRSLLMAERLVLNFMQRMSGIATETRKYADVLTGLKAKVLDTRKTTPNFRWIEKESVRIGGGLNHRFGLYDMILIKDNHIDFCGGIKNALENTRKYLLDNELSIKVEIEARSLADVREILDIAFADRIMLDNFERSDLRSAVAMIGDQAETEASGGITLENIRAYGECGVDFISVGALTHQIHSLDLSLKAIHG